ncbi:hypothetical protein [Gymnodinialimonas sp.]
MALKDLGISVDMQFFDNYLPLLYPDTYTIAVGQNFTADTPPDGAPTSFSAVKQQFTVAGPRFSLNPAEIHHQFPPPDSQGQYAEALPQVVLNMKALPWERCIFGGQSPTDRDKATPWMALLLLDQDELVRPVAGTTPNTGSGAPSPNVTGVATITLDDLLSPPTGVYGPQGLTLGAHEAGTATCQVFEITPEIFAKVIPIKADLPFLATCREVDVTAKATGGTDAAPSLATPAVATPGSRTFSVVCGNRFPANPDTVASGQASVVHLVSLEGFTDYLNDPSGFTFPSGTSQVRMVSLASWSFTSLKEAGQSFSSLMTGLIPDDGEADALWLRKPQATAPAATGDAQEAQTYVSDALDAGYIARTFATRQGEQTFSWYRGPFVPSLPEPVAQDAPFLNASQAAVYDQTTGLFDMSYAVAFETGRLKALSSKTFGAALRRWQTLAHRAIDRLAAAYLLAEKTGHGGTATLEGLNSALVADLASDPFVNKMTTDVVQQIEGAIHSKTARPQPSRNAPAQSSNVEVTQALLSNPDVQAYLQQMDQEALGPITDYLARLWLLDGVPFNALVPDQAMLQRETVRFFYVDSMWQRAMLEGALATGIQSSRDGAYQLIMECVIAEAVQKTVQAVRTKLLGLTADPPADVSTLPVAGMLLRSAAVTGWPTLEVRGFRDANRSELIPLLRMQRLSPDVLLVLFTEVPAWIEIDQPREGLHYGVELDTQTEPMVYLRQISGDATGQLYDPQQEIPVTIDPDTRILDVQTLVSDLATALGETTLTPSEYALQTIAAPQQMVFSVATRS